MQTIIVFYANMTSPVKTDCSDLVLQLLRSTNKNVLATERMRRTYDVWCICGKEMAMLDHLKKEQEARMESIMPGYYQRMIRRDPHWHVERVAQLVMLLQPYFPNLLLRDLTLAQRVRYQVQHLFSPSHMKFSRSTGYIECGLMNHQT